MQLNTMSKYCYDYPRPAVTVDLVVLARNKAGNKLYVLLIKRGKPPYEGSWAIPGGFLDMNETTQAAAVRELKEETGLVVPKPPRLVGVYDHPDRDPRGRVIAVTYGIVLDQAYEDIKVAGQDDAAEAAWHDCYDAKRMPLAFDHNQELDAALNLWARGRL